MSHTLHVGPAAAPKQYLFVDTVRFWSMLGIVAMHAIELIDIKPSEGGIPLPIISLFKFATIAFFLISGFLLGDRMATAAPLPYLSRRLRVLLIPWALWFSLYTLYMVAGDVAHHRIASFSSLSSWSHTLRADLLLAAFSSAFWFVPNLAFGICMLMLFRRYLYSLKLGAMLFALNLVYVVDIYAEWFPPAHTSALFAFVSFLWLGSFAARNFSRVSSFIDGIPMLVIAALTVLSYLGSIAEMKFLITRHSMDPTNTLRISNQVFAIFVVLLLFKLKSVSWPSFINVRQQTYAIYLLHSFCLRIGLVLLDHGLPAGSIAGAGPATSFLLRGFLFVFGYGGSLLVAGWIANSDRWRWTIGLKPREVPVRSSKIQAIKTSNFGLGGGQLS